MRYVKLSLHKLKLTAYTRASSSQRQFFYWKFNRLHILVLTCVVRCKGWPHARAEVQGYLMTGLNFELFGLSQT